MESHKNPTHKGNFFAVFSYFRKKKTMYIGLQHAHSGLAYLALLALIGVIFYALYGALTGKGFTEKDRKIAMVAFILAHIQLLIGLILYFVSPKGYSLLASGSAMGDAAARLTALEHPVINIIAIVLISVGYIRAKKLTVDTARFRSIYMFYAIGLVLILSRIPWTSWLG
ncbi:hypothetical protein A3SI_03735 [Nitritalea halalkaliphila LW7]|uniref:50S ribosomal protein L27 n=2 Tax=Nitritalea TaxID=1187887 RepID=I5C961_9BACT|nr:hypothetical protein A3SI_03735 [Nitritalea halalkaliphila LW7]